MLPFLRVFLFAGVVIGVVTIVFIGLAASDEPSARLLPLEQDDLRNQARHREIEPISPTALPTSTDASDAYEFRSGLTLEERRALREQLRGVNPELLIDGRALSESIGESVAVNESFPDGVSVQVPDAQGHAGLNR